jgi:tetratricopeptide (TPR) repeat protein
MMQSDDATTQDFDSLWDYDHPDATEVRFRQLLSQIPPQTAQYAQLLTQIARAQGLQRHFAEAHQTLAAVQELLPTTPDRTSIRYLLELGRVFNSARQPEHARPLFLQAWDVARRLHEDFYAVDAAHMLGIIEPADRQLVWNLRALEQAERTLDPRARHWVGSLYNNIGWSYHDAQRYDDALAMFQKALQWRTAQGSMREIQIARWCVGRTLRSLQRIEEALLLQRALADELAECGEKDGYVSEEIAECLLLSGHSDEARGYFALAYRELSQDAWLAEREPARVERLQKLGVEV